MKYLVLLLTVVYLSFMVSCGTNNNEHAGHSHNEQAEDHSHEGEDQDHDTDGHSHEGEDQDHDTDGHSHEGEDQDHDTDGHSHEGEDHDHDTDGHSHEGEDQDHDHESDEEQDSALTHSHSDHTIITLNKTDFSSSYKTSGQIMPDRKDEVMITAKTSGIVRFSDHFLYPGVKTSKGQTVFTISGENMTDNNAGVNFAKIKANYETSSANYSRASDLIKDKLITQEHFLNTQLIFKNAEAEYKNYSSTVSGDISRVGSPGNGYINEIFVTEGQMVKAGDRLASVMLEQKLVVKAEIPPADISILQRVYKANFSTVYSEKIYSTEEMNGSMISYGRSTSAKSCYIPVYFKIDYDKDLISGSFADIWLLGETIHDVIVIPNSSIMEEYGKYYVFVEFDHDEFEKRYFEPGPTDGKVTHALAGLHAGENIVATGTYQVKLSMLNSSLPDQHAGHNH